MCMTSGSPSKFLFLDNCKCDEEDRTAGRLIFHRVSCCSLSVMEQLLQAYRLAIKQNYN